LAGREKNLRRQESIFAIAYGNFVCVIFGVSGGEVDGGKEK
jgi:hypothetical protein